MIPNLLPRDLTTYLDYGQQSTISPFIKVRIAYGLEKTRFVSHLLDLAKLQCLHKSPRKPKGKCTAFWRLSYGFKNTGAALCMPSLDAAVELLTSVVDAVVVVLIVQRPRKTVPEHALSERR